MISFGGSKTRDVSENGCFHDKKKVFNMFADYPWKLTFEEKSIFDKENPEWAEYFKDRN